MNFAELVMLNGPVEDYTKVDSQTLLQKYADARECLRYVVVALEHPLSLLDKEFKAAGPSEAAMQIAEGVMEILADYQMLVRRIAAIESEVVRRTSRNATNRYFGQFKIGVTRGDRQLQEEALRHLYKLCGGIPWKKGWFHPEGRNGIESLAGLLLTKELNKYEHLDLPSTLEYMMDNRFAYLHCAFERDFIDEMDKLNRRPFETILDPDVMDEEEGERQETEGTETDLVDKIHRGQLMVRLREAAIEQDKPVDREIIIRAADLLGAGDSLKQPDRAIRAPLVNQISGKLRVSKQSVRRHLIRGTALPTIKRVLQPKPPEKRFKVVLTDENEEK